MMARPNAQMMAEKAAEKLRQSAIQQAEVAKEAIKAIDEGADPAEAFKAAEEKVYIKTPAFIGANGQLERNVRIFFPKNDQPFSFYVDFPSGECRHFTVEANGLAMVDAQMAEILAAKYGCRIEES